MILIDRFVIEFIDVRWLYYTLLPTLVFLFFNARRQPKCFSGDVGAVVSGYVLLYALLMLLIQTGNVVYLASVDGGRSVGHCARCLLDEGIYTVDTAGTVTKVED